MKHHTRFLALLLPLPLFVYAACGRTELPEDEAHKHIAEPQQKAAVSPTPTPPIPCRTPTASCLECHP